MFFVAFLVLFLVSVFASVCFVFCVFLVLFLVSVFAFAGAKFADKARPLCYFLTNSMPFL